MIEYGNLRKSPWMGSTRWNSRWCVDTGTLQESSLEWHSARRLCEAAQTRGAGGAAQVARGFGFAGFGRAKTALGEIASTDFELEGAICRINNMVR